MTPAGAVIRALAPVLTDAAAELRELQHQGVVQQSLVPQVVVEGEHAIAERYPSGSRSRRRRRCPGSEWVSKPPVCTQ